MTRPSGAAAGGPAAARRGLSRRLQAMLWLAVQSGLLFFMLNLLSIVTVAQKDLFGLYYAPLFPLLTMLWFWTVFVAYAERRHVRYEVCFSAEDQQYLMHSDHLFRVRVWVCASGVELGGSGWSQLGSAAGVGRAAVGKRKSGTGEAVGKTKSGSGEAGALPATVLAAAAT